MPNDHIQNILAEFEKEFCFRKVSQDSSYDIGGNHRAQDAKSFLLFSLTSTYTAGYEAGLGDAEKCVPVEREEDWRKVKTNSRGAEVSIANNNAIFNSCRTITLEGIKKLKNK